MIDYSFID